jgi:hypothetical protein
MLHCCHDISRAEIKQFYWQQLKDGDFKAELKKKRCWNTRQQQKGEGK